MRRQRRRPRPEVMPFVPVNLVLGRLGSALQADVRRLTRPAKAPQGFALTALLATLGLGLANGVQAQTSAATPVQGQALAASPGQEAARDLAANTNVRGGRDAAQPRAVTITPTFDSLFSYVQTSGRTGLGNYSDFVTQLRPGLQINARTGRLRGTLVYFLDANHHTRSTNNNTPLQNSLNANGNAEVIQNWFFVDGRASITQQARSAYGQQTASGSLSASDNQTEVGTLYVSPYLKGRVADLASYETRFTTEATNARRSIIGDSTNNTVSLSLNSPRSGARFGWGAVATKRQTAYRAGRTTDEERAVVSAIARPDTDLTVTLRAGREAQNVSTLERRSDNNFGAGLTWSPSNRTSAAIDADRRYFGQSYRVLVDHRLLQSSFRLSASRDVSNNQSSSSGGGGPATTAFELQFRNLTAQFPDPKQRAEVALALLQGRGQDPNAVFSSSFLSSGVTLVQRLDLSWIYTGRRQTFSLLAFSSDTSNLGVLAPGATNLNDVRQSGLTGSVSHRLTPTANVSLVGTLLHTAGNQGNAGNDLKSMQLNWSDTLNRYTTATLGARYSVFDSPLDPYREAALTATIAMRF
jgi:uncharacterized protein (PEP-CTERM system associated)